MRYKVHNNEGQKVFAVVLDSGDEVMQCIQSFAKKEKLKAFRFSAIGAFSNVIVDYFDFSIKDYKKIVTNQQVEVLNINGDISLYKGEIKVHAHVIVGKAEWSAHGGHQLTKTLLPTREIILTDSPSYLKREMDEQTGIPLIKIDA